jgi:LmbE family N-acetylglucosaminyl deacetylase
MSLTSIIIPTYNHAKFVLDAVGSALAQTAAVEVIVVDDGSTDDTVALLGQHAGSIRYIKIDHAGPCAARNAGIEAAAGDFLMFLDADDLIHPRKVEKQLAAFSDEIGWVLSDVRIEDEASGRTENASAKYDYAHKNLSGWIGNALIDSNFIPIMAPLIRRSVLGEAIRFRDDRIPEDWHFWHEVAMSARVGYVPEVLATYRHRRTGRSRIPKKARTVTPYFEQPRRLNLACGVKGTRSWHPMPGLVNLDKSMGWRFQDGLGDFVDGSVFGITISHALMYVAEAEWPPIFGELARVLAPGGVLRITEDNTADAKSSRRGGWKGSEPAVTLTDPAMMRAHLERAGFTVYDVTKDESRYRDLSLCQANYGEVPDVFFIEGVREKAVLFSPHADDETLFAAFTILRYRPKIIICFPSVGDYGDTELRIEESRAAAEVLGAAGVDLWEIDTLEDLIARMRAFDEAEHPARIFAPDANASHPDHCAVAYAALEVFAGRRTTYHTYINEEGDQAVALTKVREGQPVDFEPAWVQQKLRALARYTSQIHHPRAHKFFCDDLYEYYGKVAS